MKFPFPPGSFLYAAGGLLGVCVTAMGADAGFLLEAWRGLGAGLVLGVGVFLLIVRTTVLLCSLQTRETLRSVTMGDAEGEATAQMVLHAVVLYEAAVFPLRPGGVSAAPPHGPCHDAGGRSRTAQHGALLTVRSCFAPRRRLRTVSPFSGLEPGRRGLPRPSSTASNPAGSRPGGALHPSGLGRNSRKAALCSRVWWRVPVPLSLSW